MTDLTEELCRRDLLWILKETCETKNRIELSREWTQLKCLLKTWSFCYFHSTPLFLSESCMCTLVTDANIIQARNEVWLWSSLSSLFYSCFSSSSLLFFLPSWEELLVFYLFFTTIWVFLSFTSFFHVSIVIFPFSPLLATPFLLLKIGR